jgi:hypothetical protein
VTSGVFWPSDPSLYMVPGELRSRDSFYVSVSRRLSRHWLAWLRAGGRYRGLHEAA